MLSHQNIQCIVCGAYQENAYLVCPEGRGDAFVIDPGDDLDALRGAIAASGRTLGAILLTHGHFDHILAAQPLSDETGAAIYVHAEDADMLEDPKKSAYAPDVSRLAPPDGLAAQSYPTLLEVCGTKLQILHTPGHSRGSVCLYDAEDGVLFSGDTLFCAGFGRTDLFGGSSLALRQSLRRLFALPDGITVLCGHGPATTIAAERRRYGL